MASVAINNGMNAGLLAVRVLSAASPALVQRMESYQKTLEGEVMSKVSRIEDMGWEVEVEDRAKVGVMEPLTIRSSELEEWESQAPQGAS